MFNKDNIYVGCFFIFITLVLTMLTISAVILFNVFVDAGAFTVIRDAFTVIRELLSDISSTQTIIIVIVSLASSGFAISKLVSASKGK